MAFWLRRGTARSKKHRVGKAVPRPQLLYSLNATPLNAATPTALDVPTGVKSP